MMGFDVLVLLYPRILPLEIETARWSLDVQRLFGRETLLDIGYYGNGGTHLIGVVDINQPRPGEYLRAGVLPSGPIKSSTTPLLNYVRPYRGYEAINIF